MKQKKIYLPIGILFFNPSNPGTDSANGVLVKLGQIALILIPFLEYSKAEEYVSPTTPNFVAEYGEFNLNPTKPEIEELLTIEYSLEGSCLRICWISYFMHKKV
jgi:hypothetical protein